MARQYPNPSYCGGCIQMPESKGLSTCVASTRPRFKVKAEWPPTYGHPQLADTHQWQHRQLLLERNRCSNSQGPNNQKGDAMRKPFRSLVSDRLSSNIQWLNQHKGTQGRQKSRKQNGGWDMISKSRQLAESQHTRATIFASIRQKINQYSFNDEILEDSGPQRRTRNRRGNNRLSLLLEDVKRQNREEKNVVYTICKSKERKGNGASTNESYSVQYTEMRELKEELNFLKQELEEAKRKNKKLIAISQIKVKEGQSDLTVICRPHPRDYQPPRRPSLVDAGQMNELPKYLQPCLACGCYYRAHEYPQFA